MIARYPGLELSVAPAEEPLARADAKEHLKVEHNDEDEWIDAAITAARLSLEAELDQQLITATWKAYFDGFPGGALELPKPPLQSVSQIDYVDYNGDAQTLAAASYQVDAKSMPGRIAPARQTIWPATDPETMNAVTVTFVAGYGARAAVPTSFVLELKARTAEMYANREMLRQALVAAGWHGSI